MSGFPHLKREIPFIMRGDAISLTGDCDLHETDIVSPRAFCLRKTRFMRKMLGAQGRRSWRRAMSEKKVSDENTLL